MDLTKVELHEQLTISNYNAKKADNESIQKQVNSSNSDDVAEISEQARDISLLNVEIETIKTRVLSLPEIREARISSVKEKIAAGYYHENKFLLDS